MQTLVKTYRGRERSASNDFRRDAERMAAKGMFPTSQTWAGGSYGLGSFVVALLLCLILVGFLIFVYMIVVKPSGTLTVTYAASDAAPAPGMEKTCPKCAERVKEAAAVCRFCGHEFPAREPFQPVPLAAAKAASRQPQSAPYAFGAWFGSMWQHRWFKVATIAIPFLLFAEFVTSRAVTADDAKAASAQNQVPAYAQPFGERNKCAAERDQQVSSYRSLLKEGKAWEAAGTIRACAKTLDDSDLKKLVADAEVQSYKDTIANGKASKQDKLNAMQSLVRDYSEAGKPYESKIAPLSLQIAKDNAAGDLARRRKQGVHIGMTEAEVLQSNWGRPESVSRTTTSGGKHEQWVYGGNYLYFEDGVLTTIQN